MEVSSGTSLENYFTFFREKIIGNDLHFTSPIGNKKVVYADWTASGRLYESIERIMMDEFGPYVANTHTETTVTGTFMTHAYHEAKEIIKKHVNANSDDVLITVGSGMTGAVNKFQRILGLKIPEKIKGVVKIEEADRPIVFITHMEHHSNQTSWIETIAEVVLIDADSQGLVDLVHLRKLLEIYKNRKVKYAAVTACSNVTGIETPIYEIAEIMHLNGGYCFVDFACSAPYVDIDMHPAEPLKKLDAIFFSPHKFLGGPGTPGILLFDKKMYANRVPDQPGGGTVAWTNPWGEHKYFDDIESREDGGTPAFLQTIKTGLAIRLKEKMGTDNILKREKELLRILFDELKKIESLHILAGNIEDRLGVISFYIDGLHYNLGVKLLNDYFGIQSRGGCSCAGTYGHILLNVGHDFSKSITCKIDSGDLSDKPGWIRVSIHPIMTNDEIYFIAKCIGSLVENFKEWAQDYKYNSASNEFEYMQKGFEPSNKTSIKEIFNKV